MRIGSGYEARGIGAQIAGQRVALFDGAPSPHRQARKKLRVGLGIVHRCGIQVGSEGAGADAVDGDAFAGKCESKCSREAEVIFRMRP